jgi:hypothetical protein
VAPKQGQGVLKGLPVLRSCIIIIIIASSSSSSSKPRQTCKHLAALGFYEQLCFKFALTLKQSSLGLEDLQPADTN